MSDELLEVVDGEGRVLGLAPRSVVHSDPEMLHRVVHVLVVNRKGEILLQKRSPAKDIAPGKWDTSVGGHLAVGEAPEAGVRREMEEELGVTGEIEFLRSWIYRGARESELVFSHLCRHEGPFRPNLIEVDELRFWPVDLIRRQLGTGDFTCQFEEEFALWLSRSGGA